MQGGQQRLLVAAEMFAHLIRTFIHVDYDALMAFDLNLNHFPASRLNAQLGDWAITEIQANSMQLTLSQRQPHQCAAQDAMRMLIVVPPSLVLSLDLVG